MIILCFEILLQLPKQTFEMELRGKQKYFYQIKNFRQVLKFCFGKVDSFQIVDNFLTIKVTKFDIVYQC